MLKQILVDNVIPHDLSSCTCFQNSGFTSATFALTVLYFVFITKAVRTSHFVKRTVSYISTIIVVVTRIYLTFSLIDVARQKLMFCMKTEEGAIVPYRPENQQKS